MDHLYLYRDFSASQPSSGKQHGHFWDTGTERWGPRLYVQEKDTIRLRREAKQKGGFYVEPEAKLAFVVRIRGLNKIHPKVCSISAAGVHQQNISRASANKQHTQWFIQFTVHKRAQRRRHVHLHDKCA